MSKVELSVRLRKLRDGKDGADGKSPFVSVVSPAAISYTAGVEKTIKMSFKIVQGDTSHDVATVTPQYGTSQSTPLGVEYSVANKKLTFRSTATWEGIITFSLVYNGVTYTSAVVVSKVSNGANGKDGATGPKGDPGPAGLVYRKTEWAQGVEYRNDKSKLESGAPASESQNGDGVWYLDIVTKTDSNGKLKGVWECYSSHTSSAETDPEKESYTGDHSAHWRKFSSWGNQPIYVPLLIAEGAVIGFMQGNQLKIFDTQSNLKAGISAATGDYPIFYANPQKYPVAVAVAVCTTSADISSSPSSGNWLTPNAGAELTVSSGYKLNLRFITTFSDGTSDAASPNYRFNVNSGAAVAKGALSVSFMATPTTENANASAYFSAPATSLAKPYLWIRVGFGTVNYGPFRIAEQTAGSKPETSMYQQREDGSAIYGMPNGARIFLDAAPGAGLPRMEIFDEEGNSAATYDGSTVADGSELFGTGTLQTTLSGAQLTATAASSAYQTYSSSRAANATLTCTTEAVITIPAGIFSISAIGGDIPAVSLGALQGIQNATCCITIDGVKVASASLAVDVVGTTVSRNVSYPKISRTVSAGTHTVKFHVEFSGYKGSSYTGQANASVTSSGSTSIAVALAATLQKCRYFANGFAIGSATNNYCMAWNQNGVMNFVCENANAGLRVTSSGVEVKKSDGTWVSIVPS